MGRLVAAGVGAFVLAAVRTRRPAGTPALVWVVMEILVD